MKKTSTLALSLLLAAGAWCGLAYAADGDAPTTGSTEAQTETFDFAENQYGVTPVSDSNHYETEAMTGTEGDITMTVTGKYRLWKKDNTLRLYKASTDEETAAHVEFTATEGATIEKVVFEVDKSSDKSKLGNLALADGVEGTLDAGTWTGSADKVTFEATATVNISRIIVTYVGGEEDTRETPILWGMAPKPSYFVALGSAYSFPWVAAHLPGSYETLPMVYTSSNPEVATIDNAGEVEVVAPGETTISCVVKETETYKGLSVSYNLTVGPEGSVYYSPMGKDFTFENPADADIWSHSEKYGLTANGYINKVNYASDVIAVSPEITLKENFGFTLDFDEVINYLKGNPVGDYLKVCVAVIEKGNDDNKDPDFGGYYDAAPEEETPALNWVEINDAVTAPAEDSYTVFPNKTIDLSEYAGKTIKIGFRYISTADFGAAWQITKVTVKLVDPLAADKEATVEKFMEYWNQSPMATDEDSSSMLRYYTQTIKDCETKEELEAAFDYVIAGLIDNINTTMDLGYTWAVGDKFVSYVENPETPENPDEPGEDGISSIGIQGNATVIYDLQGRRVSNAANGIYIINGKKVLVKGSVMPTAEAADDAAAEPTTPETEGEGEETPAEETGLSHWQLAEYSNASIFKAERVNERSFTPFAADDNTEAEEGEGEGEGEGEETREAKHEDAVTIYNKLSGLYLAQPTAAGEIIGTTADKAEAGYFYVTTVEGGFAIADDATDLFVAFDDVKGATLSADASLALIAGVNTWDDKEDGCKISIGFDDAEYQGYDEFSAEKFGTITFAVSTNVKPSGMGSIVLNSVDPMTGDFIVIAKFTGAQLAELTPEKGEGYEYEYFWNNETNTQEITKVPFEAEVYTFALRDVITTPGMYFLEIESGTFMSETENGTLYNPVMGAVCYIEGEVNVGGDWSPVVTPAEGTVTELETITIDPTEGVYYCALTWSGDDSTITLTNGETLIQQWTMEEVYNANVADWNAEYNTPESADKYVLTLKEKITAKGTYTLTIPAGFFEEDGMGLNGETVITWTIE